MTAAWVSPGRRGGKAEGGGVGKGEASPAWVSWQAVGCAPCLVRNCLLLGLHYLGFLELYNVCGCLSTVFLMEVLF